MDAFGYFGHLVIGTTVAVMLAHNPIYFMVVIVGSLLPDIDSQASLLGRFNPLAGFCKHRGHFHSILGIAILASPFLLLGIKVYIFGFIGALSHLLGDKFLSWFPRHSRFRIKMW